MQHRIAVATRTRYTDQTDVRYGLVMRMLTMLNFHQYPAVLVDNSPPNIHEVFRKCGDNIFVLDTNESETMGMKLRRSITMALQLAGDKGAVAYVDPEKFPMVPYLPRLCAPILNGEADIVIGERESLDSYPPIQQWFERIGNTFFGAYTGLACDAWFGVRAFNAKGAAPFLDYDGAYGDQWDSAFTPLVRAIAQGLKIITVKVPYAHPAMQTGAEEHDVHMHEKRRTQLNTLVEMLAKEAQRLGLPR